MRHSKLQDGVNEYANIGKAAFANSVTNWPGNEVWQEPEMAPWVATGEQITGAALAALDTISIGRAEGVS